MNKYRNRKLSKILELTSCLTKQELVTLNQAIVSLIKAKQDVAFKQASINFSKGDIVSFQDSSGDITYGVVTKKNPKTLRVTMEDNCYVNIPATYLSHVDNPSKDLLEFQKAIEPTYEQMAEIIGFEMEDKKFH